MTREEYKKHIRNLFYSSKTVEKYLEQAYTDIDKIFDEHEVQLKAKDEDLKLAMDLSEHMLDELKTEIGIKEYLAKELKAKDEEIERLKSDVYHMSYVIKEWQGNKARSIVAMLFWEYKRYKRILKPYVKRDMGYINGIRVSFQQSYKMLKDNA